MKKILVASAALLMTTGLAGIAQAADAEPGVNLKSDAHVRAVYRDNDILDVAVVSVNSEGEEIARTGQDNFIVFIPQ